MTQAHDNIGASDSAGVTLFGVSCDPAHPLEAFAQQEGYRCRPALRLLAAYREALAAL